MEEVPDRMPDDGRCEQVRRHLVQQRLERVVVVPVDQDDFGVGVLEALRRTDPSETASEDQNSRLRSIAGQGLALPSFDHANAHAWEPSARTWQA